MKSRSWILGNGTEVKSSQKCESFGGGRAKKERNMNTILCAGGTILALRQYVFEPGQEVRDLPRTICVTAGNDCLA